MLVYRLEVVEGRRDLSYMPCTGKTVAARFCCLGVKKMGRLSDLHPLKSELF